ncbi:hypothetical protein [Pseudomonas sp. NPDC086251]|uniref:hypothetical protein n=1 Tax=Pseudomonas sp. NPDC086251 TaxID=3364431 RepID=UPI003835F74A
MRSLWAAGAPGYRSMAEQGSAVLFHLSQAAGWMDVTLAQCQLTRSYVEAYRR